MGLKIKTGLLLCLMSAAVCSCLAAYRSMHASASAMPEEIYAQFMDSAPIAEYYLRDSGGHVAVFSFRNVHFHRDGAADVMTVCLRAVSAGSHRRADRHAHRDGLPAHS